MKDITKANVFSKELENAKGDGYLETAKRIALATIAYHTRHELVDLIETQDVSAEEKAAYEWISANVSNTIQNHRHIRDLADDSPYINEVCVYPESTEIAFLLDPFPCADGSPEYSAEKAIEEAICEGDIESGYIQYYIWRFEVFGISDYLRESLEETWNDYGEEVG